MNINKIKSLLLLSMVYGAVSDPMVVESRSARSDIGTATFNKMGVDAAISISSGGKTLLVSSNESNKSTFRDGLANGTQLPTFSNTLNPVVLFTPTLVASKGRAGHFVVTASKNTSGRNAVTPEQVKENYKLPTVSEINTANGLSGNDKLAEDTTFTLSFTTSYNGKQFVVNRDFSKSDAGKVASVLLEVVDGVVVSGSIVLSDSVNVSNSLGAITAFNPNCLLDVLALERLTLQAMIGGANTDRTASTASRFATVSGISAPADTRDQLAKILGLAADTTDTTATAEAKKLLWTAAGLFGKEKEFTTFTGSGTSLKYDTVGTNGEAPFDTNKNLFDPTRIGTLNMLFPQVPQSESNAYALRDLQNLFTIDTNGLIKFNSDWKPIVGDDAAVATTTDTSLNSVVMTAASLINPTSILGKMFGRDKLVSMFDIKTDSAATPATKSQVVLKTGTDGKLDVKEIVGFGLPYTTKVLSSSWGLVTPNSDETRKLFGEGYSVLPLGTPKDEYAITTDNVRSGSTALQAYNNKVNGFGNEREAPTTRAQLFNLAPNYTGKVEPVLNVNGVNLLTATDEVLTTAILGMFKGETTQFTVNVPVDPKVWEEVLGSDKETRKKTAEVLLALSNNGNNKELNIIRNGEKKSLEEFRQGGSTSESMVNGSKVVKETNNYAIPVGCIYTAGGIYATTNKGVNITVTTTTNANGEKTSTITLESGTSPVASSLTNALQAYLEEVATGVQLTQEQRDEIKKLEAFIAAAKAVPGNEETIKKAQARIDQIRKGNVEEKAAKTALQELLKAYEDAVASGDNAKIKAAAAKLLAAQKLSLAEDKPLPADTAEKTKAAAAVEAFKAAIEGLVDSEESEKLVALLGKTEEFKKAVKALDDDEARTALSEAYDAYQAALKAPAPQGKAIETKGADKGKVGETGIEPQDAPKGADKGADKGKTEIIPANPGKSVPNTTTASNKPAAESNKPVEETYTVKTPEGEAKVDYRGRVIGADGKPTGKFVVGVVLPKTENKAPVAPASTTDKVRTAVKA